MKCHYCRKYPADTKDHIVPRAVLVPQRELPDWYRNFNKVPACKACNNLKDVKRSSCDCPQCEWSWKIAEAFFMNGATVHKGVWEIPSLKRVNGNAAN